MSGSVSGANTREHFHCFLYLIRLLNPVNYYSKYLRYLPLKSVNSLHIPAKSLPCRFFIFCVNFPLSLSLIIFVLSKSPFLSLSLSQFSFSPSLSLFLSLSSGLPFSLSAAFRWKISLMNYASAGIAGVIPGTEIGSPALKGASAKHGAAS